jgi:hypothetical protein
MCEDELRVVSKHLINVARGIPAICEQGLKRTPATH